MNLLTKVLAEYGGQNWCRGVGEDGWGVVPEEVSCVQREGLLSLLRR